MKKVVYSVQKLGKMETPKMTGLGYVTEKDLVIACISQKGKPYIRVFEDCIKDCYPISGKPGEFKGSSYEIREVQIDTGSFQNDMTTFRSKDDVLTLLIHLGYLGYDFSHACVFIPNNEIKKDIPEKYNGCPIFNF